MQKAIGGALVIRIASGAALPRTVVRPPSSRSANPLRSFPAKEIPIELIRAGRSPAELAREFEPTAQTIQNWVTQYERDRGTRTDGPTTAEQVELRQLRREVRQLKLERDILSKAAAWFARETGTIPKTSREDSDS